MHVNVRRKMLKRSKELKLGKELLGIVRFLSPDLNPVFRGGDQKTLPSTKKASLDLPTEGCWGIANRAGTDSKKPYRANRSIPFGLASTAVRIQ